MCLLGVPMHTCVLCANTFWFALLMSSSMLSSTSNDCFYFVVLFGRIKSDRLIDYLITHHPAKTERRKPRKQWNKKNRRILNNQIWNVFFLSKTNEPLFCSMFFSVLVISLDGEMFDLSAKKKHQSNWIHTTPHPSSFYQLYGVICFCFVFCRKKMI